MGKYFDDLVAMQQLRQIQEEVNLIKSWFNEQKTDDDAPTNAEREIAALKSLVLDAWKCANEEVTEAFRDRVAGEVAKLCKL